MQILVILILLGASVSGYNYVDPKIYTFAFPGIEPGSRFNGTDLIGAQVELMKEVCCRAAKRCFAVLVDFDQCWSRESMSQVLNNRLYDVCMEVLDSAARRASYAFSDIYFASFNEQGLSIAVGLHSNVTLEDLRNPRNNIKVAWPGSVRPDSRNLRRFWNQFFVTSGNFVPIAGPDVAGEMLKLIRDPCSGVDVGLLVNARVKPSDKGTFKILKKMELQLAKSNLMVRKDDQHILDWWDFTLKRFMCSEDWQPFCERLDKELGPHPLNCPPLDQIDCSDCSVPHRVSGCPCTDSRT